MFNSIDDGSEKFLVGEDSNECFPSNDGDEFPNYVQNDHSEDNIPLNDDENAYREDDEMMNMLPKNIVSRIRSIPLHINPRYSVYTRGREEYLMRKSSINDLF